MTGRKKSWIEESGGENLFISPVFTQFPRKQEAFNIGKSVIGCHPHFRAALATAKHKNDYIIVVMTLSVPKVKEVRSIKKFEKNLFYFSTSIKDDVSP